MMEKGERVCVVGTGFQMLLSRWGVGTAHPSARAVGDQLRTFWNELGAAEGVTTKLVVSFDLC